MVGISRHHPLRGLYVVMDPVRGLSPTGFTTRLRTASPALRAHLIADRDADGDGRDAGAGYFGTKGAGAGRNVQ